MRRLFTLALALLLMQGCIRIDFDLCEEEPSNPACPNDAAPESDGGPPDAGPADAGSVDAGSVDAA
ncbi:MAG: hypothetical protein AB8I08_14185 [Sandaracinaceae bacterium]